jgi:O-antigen/teichoic acid export membrane protein
MTVLMPPPAAEEPLEPPVITGVGRDAVWTYVGLAASTLAGLFVAAYVLRTLTPADYGAFSIAVTIAGLLVVFDFGISAGAVRASARERRATTEAVRDDARAEVQGAHALNLLIAAATLGCTAVALLWQLLSSSSGRVATMSLLIGLSAALGFASATFLGIATGQRRFRLVAAAVASGAAVRVLVVLLLARPLGLVALGLAELAAIATARGALVWGVRRSAEWFRPTRPRAGRAAYRASLAFSGPLLVLGVAGQVIASTDVLVLGVMSTAAVVGLYRVGSTVPTQLAILLQRGQDSAFPALAGSDDRRSQERAVELLTRVFAVVAGALFGVVILERASLAALLVGRPSPLAASVVGLFAAIWLVDLPARGISLLLIARAEQKRLVRLVAVEAAANLVLTVVLVATVGPLGGAWATLGTIGVANLVILPVLARRFLSISAARLVMVSGVGHELLGFLAALGALVLASALPAGAVRLAGAGVVAGILGAALVAAVSGPGGRSELARAVLPARSPNPDATQEARADAVLS